MRKVTVIIETCENNLSAYIKDVDGIVATGATLLDVKRNIEDGIAMHIETCKEFGFPVPELLNEEYELVYKYDLQSFLESYKEVLSKSGLERLTGIHQKQLWHYASGKSKPRKETICKVETSIHELAKELAAIEFAY